MRITKLSSDSIMIFLAPAVKNTDPSPVFSLLNMLIISTQFLNDVNLGQRKYAHKVQVGEQELISFEFIPRKKKNKNDVGVSEICINFVYTPEVGVLVIYDVTRHLSKPRFENKYLD